MTRLGLAGVPRARRRGSSSAPDASARPGAARFSALGPAGAPRRPPRFTAKGETGTQPRPIGRHSALGPLGAPMARRASFASKSTVTGSSGHVTVTFTPSAATHYGRRYTVVPDIELAIFPVGAAITVAHKNELAGSSRVTVTPTAETRYTRQGRHHAMQGDAGVTITPFGAMRYRVRIVQVGQIAIGVTPQARVKYTPAPVRHHQLLGRTTLQVTPAARLTHEAHGVAYGLVGGATLQVTPSGRMAVRRQTIYRMQGRVTVSLEVRGLTEKGSGPPQAYRADGRTVLSVTPQSSMKRLIEPSNHYAIAGAVAIQLQPRARLAYGSPPSIVRYDRPGRRRFIRVFARGSKP